MIRSLCFSHGAGFVVEGRYCVAGQCVGCGVRLALFVPDVKVEFEELLLQAVQGLGVDRAECFQGFVVCEEREVAAAEVDCEIVYRPGGCGKL